MSKQTFTVLFSCIGRRVALVNAFRESLKRLGLKGRIIGVDRSPFSSAIEMCDSAVIVPSSDEASYVARLIEVCRQEHVDLLIPLIDPELHVLAGRNEDFRAVGTTLCLSAEKVVRTCRDKTLTYKELAAAKIDTPRLFDYEKVTDADFPLFMKPRRGSAAKDIHKISDRAELEFYHSRVPGAVIQEFLDGQEYTLDVFADFDGRPLCVVPRKRIEVRGGEVSKSMTVKDLSLIELGKRTVEALGGCMGPITIQCFHTTSGRRAVIEVNPRLGGGVPLSLAAGADIPTWTIQCALGRKPEVDPMAFKDRLVMLRYDEAVFVREDELTR